VRVMENPAMSSRLPLERPARVTILTHHGDRYSAEVGANRGDEALPYTAEELSHKFVSLVSRVWPVSHAQALLAATLRLAEYAEDFDHWSSLLDFPTSLDAHYGTF
jgi:2-methylcitrate dehydratase PrpD